MSQGVFVSGELTGDIISSVMIDLITQMVAKGTNEKVFECNPDPSTGTATIWTKKDEYWGLSPEADYIFDPLIRLTKLAEKNGITLNGHFMLEHSDSNDKTYLDVKDNEISILNGHLVEADTMSLIMELERRGVLPEDFSLDDFADPNAGL